MEQPSTVSASRTVQNVALAYFSDLRGVSDSVRDLCTAGFAPASINISQSAAEQASSPTVDVGTPLHNAVGEHSKQWLWNRTLSHDWQRKGADQISGLNPLPSEGANPTCLAFDLQIVLTAMSVPAVVIGLLLHDVQRQGMFVLVDALDRVREAERILANNAGFLRTQYLRVN